MTQRKDKNVLFITYPAVSHYISILPCALELKSQGYTIYFTGINKYKDVIIRNEMNFIETKYYESYYINNLKTGVLLFLKCLRKSFHKKRFKTILFLSESLKSCVKNLSIDMIFLDAQLSIYYILLPKEVELNIFNTKLSTLRSLGLPPLSCGIIFRNTFFYKQLANFLWLKKYATNLFKILMDKIAFAGITDDYLFKRIFLKEGFDFRHYFIANYKSCFHYEFNYKNITTPVYITGLKAIEYEWKILQENERYLQYNISKVSFNLHLSQEFKTFINNFESLRLNKEVKLIYCSLGTMTNRNEILAKEFLIKIIKSMANLSNYMLILSTGGLNLNVSNLQKNILIERMLPQRDILKSCDLMITHGGMNSITECFYYHVPMLVYPLSNNLDQTGNAARVASKGLGLVGNIKRDSINVIRKRITDAVLIDKSRFQKY